jgi:hypothetical protein
MNKLNLVILTLCFTMLATSIAIPSQADNTNIETDRLYKQWVKYHEEGKSTYGLQFLRQAAEKGHAQAQATLGELFYFGGRLNLINLDHPKIDMKRDIYKALEWLFRAADLGNAQANYILGIIYEYQKPEDKGAYEPNAYVAIRYYKKAAQKGNQSAIKIVNRIGKYEILYEWGSKFLPRVARTVYLTNDLKIVGFEATASFSQNNEKRVYLSIGNAEEDLCNPKDFEKKLVTSVWEINNQAVNMIKFCNRSNVNERFLISVTPYSIQGFNFLISSLINASYSITIRGEGYEFPISSRGFTKEWNTMSNKAL